MKLPIQSCDKSDRINPFNIPGHVSTQNQEEWHIWNHLQLPKALTTHTLKLSHQSTD